MIGVMAKVENADAAYERVTALGGSARPAFDIADRLRMAVCADPSGAGFDVWEYLNSHGTEVDGDLHGAPSWFETMTTDVERAATFYSGLFGWAPEVTPMPGSTYTTCTHGAGYVAGMLQITPQMGEVRPRWGTFFTVKDVDETLREAARLGASVCVRMRDVAGVGRFCGLASRQGVPFSVIQYQR